MIATMVNQIHLPEVTNKKKRRMGTYDVSISSFLD